MLQFFCHCSGKETSIFLLEAEICFLHGGFMHLLLGLNLHVCPALWLHSFSSGS